MQQEIFYYVSEPLHYVAAVRRIKCVAVMIEQFE
jgi:hypothetical protein